jgi:hypothetical protein
VRTGPRLALVVLSVVEQRLDAVSAVLSGAKVTEVAAAIGMSRQSAGTGLRRGRLVQISSSRGSGQPLISGEAHRLHGKGY